MAVRAGLNTHYMIKHGVIGLAGVLITTHDFLAITSNGCGIVVDVGETKLVRYGILIRQTRRGDTLVHLDHGCRTLVAGHADCFTTQPGHLCPRWELYGTELRCSIIMAGVAGNYRANWGIGVHLESSGTIRTNVIQKTSGTVTFGTIHRNFFGVFLIPVNESLSSRIGMRRSRPFLLIGSSCVRTGFRLRACWTLRAGSCFSNRFCGFWRTGCQDQSQRQHKCNEKKMLYWCFHFCSS